MHVKLKNMPLWTAYVGLIAEQKLQNAIERSQTRTKAIQDERMIVDVVLRDTYA